MGSGRRITGLGQRRCGLRFNQFIGSFGAGLLKPDHVFSPEFSLVLDMDRRLTIIYTILHFVKFTALR